MCSVSLFASSLLHLNVSASVQALQMGILLTFPHACSSGAAQAANSLLRRSLRHLLLQPDETSWYVLRTFQTVPRKCSGESMLGVSFLSLGSFSLVKDCKKSNPMAHCHHHSLDLVATCAAGSIPQEHFRCVLPPHNWSGSPASSLFFLPMFFYLLN